VSSGQPSVAKGQSADENHVSSTSSSRRSSAPPHSAQASGSVSAQVTWPSGQYQIGSWWPHHSCRETFHGRIAFSQSSATRLCTSGWKVTRPDSIASIAAAAIGFMSHHHCSETSGWTRVPERSQWPTECRYDSRFSSRPSWRNHSTT
jgi:hypothetical protein